MDEHYEKLIKKYRIPDYDVLDHEFEVSTLEDEQFFLRGVREKISEKIERLVNMFDDLLHPKSTFTGNVESNVLTDEDKEKIIDIMKRLMYFYRRVTELQIDDSDKKNAEFINEVFKEWDELKKKSLLIVGKLKEAWTQDVLKKEVVGYLG